MSAFLRPRRLRFRLVLDAPSFTNLCFWYLPPSLASFEPHKLKGTAWAALHEARGFDEGVWCWGCLVLARVCLVLAR